MKYFVEENSIVREIWGKADNILFIFAGASAEFALNKAIDWLYFTGKLPADPLGRLFSTVSYARVIVFSKEKAALRAIDSMATIHSQVETNRGAKIPDWAYRDVLFMLIDYSIRAFELLERKLTSEEKQEVFNVFFRLGDRMGLNGLPQNFPEWKKMRREYLQNNLKHSHYTDDLFRQYRKHLGPMRFCLLQEAQIMVMPQQARKLLGYRKTSFLRPLIILYKLGRHLKFDRLLKSLILPPKYKKEILALDKV